MPFRHSLLISPPLRFPPPPKRPSASPSSANIANTVWRRARNTADGKLRNTPCKWQHPHWTGRCAEQRAFQSVFIFWLIPHLRLLCFPDKVHRRMRSRDKFRIPRKCAPWKCAQFVRCPPAIFRLSIGKCPPSCIPRRFPRNADIDSNAEESAVFAHS